jgi:hypothetical protein
MTDDPDRLLSEFIDAWNAGQRPRSEDYLARAPDQAREELEAQIETFLQWAPTPDYDEQTTRELMEQPAVLAATAAFDAEVGLWPALLPRLRERTRLTRSELAGRLAGALGVQGREAKTERYLEEMESGRLDPGGVSRRVLDALGAILGIGGEELERTGSFATWDPAPALLRSEPDTAASVGHLEVLADAMAAPPPSEEWDEVDQLFRGGR